FSLFILIIFVYILPSCTLSFLFFFNYTATTEIYTLSLHDALPISKAKHVLPFHPTHGVHEVVVVLGLVLVGERRRPDLKAGACQDRKSTRLNSSHEWISYAVFCLKKKKKSTTKSL